MTALLYLIPTLILSQAAGLIGDARGIDLDAFLRDAKSYRIESQGDSPHELVLVPRSVLNWGSAERNDENGSIFVWTRNGRPEVIGAIWSLYRPNTKETVWRHGLQSLSQEPLTAHFESKLIWSPRQPGLCFQLVENTVAPEADPQRRLVQMRNIARDFRVEIDEQSGVTSQLRLLTQPLFRYEPVASTTLDGTIFAFSAGSDPDALLILEARKTDEKLRWEFAFGRLHFVAMRAVRGDKTAWSVERDLENRRHRFGADPGREKIYYSVVRPR